MGPTKLRKLKFSGISFLDFSVILPHKQGQCAKQDRKFRVEKQNPRKMKVCAQVLYLSTKQPHKGRASIFTLAMCKTIA